MAQNLNLQEAVDYLIDETPEGAPFRDGADLCRLSERQRLDDRVNRRAYAVPRIICLCKDGEWKATGKKPGSADREHIPGLAFVDSKINWHTGNLMSTSAPVSTRSGRMVAIWTELKFSVPGGANVGKGAELPGPAIVAGGARIGGRPTLKAEIEAAYRDLREAGQIDFDAPKNRLYEPIRKWVQEHKGDPSLEKGLRDEAIRKVIHPLFDTDKNKRSASP